MKDINQLIFDEDWTGVRRLLDNPPCLPLRGDADDFPPLHHLAMAKWFMKDEEKAQEISTVDGLAATLIRLGDVPESIPEAACFGQMDTVKAMLAGGRKIDEKEGAPVGTTGLLVASRFGTKEMVAFFIAQGASVDETDVEGRYAYDLADDPAIKELLKKHGCADKATEDEEYEAYCTARSDLNDLRDVNLAFMRAAQRGDVEELRRQLNRSSCKPWTLNLYFMPEKETPLHHAVNAARTEAVRFLVSAGADTGVKNQAGRTPLDLARERGLSEIVALLKMDKRRPNQAPEDTSLRADPQR